MRPPKAAFIDRSQPPEKEEVRTVPDGYKCQAPVINWNGTSADALKGQVKEAADATYKLLDKLAEMFPHGRDYQTLPSAAYQRARSEHESRQARVQSVLDELHDIYQQLLMQER